MSKKTTDEKKPTASLQPSILPASFAADETIADAAKALIAKTAAEVKEGGTPDAFNRWNSMTPQTLKENQEAREAIMRRVKTVNPRKVTASKPAKGSISSGLPKHIEPAGLKLKAELDKTREQSKMERLKALREAKASSKFDGLLTPNRKATEKPADALKAKGAVSPPLARKTQPANGSASAKAKKPSKMDQATELLKKAKGASQKELFELTGWKYTNVKELAERAKMKLTQDGERYRLVA